MSTIIRTDVNATDAINAIETTLGAFEADFDVRGIYQTLRDAGCSMADIANDNVPDDTFWAAAAAHDVTASA